VIYDANRVVCSLPPIINGDHSKIHVGTRNVFIEVTAADKTKLEIVTNIMCAMFSTYCEEQFTVEPVKIISPHNGCTRVSPSLNPRSMAVELDYVNSCTGLSGSAEYICNLLAKMAYTARPSAQEGILDCIIPPTRPDVLHQCDVMEDVAIAYGYNALPRSSPNRSVTIGQPLLINRLADLVRSECAMAGWLEVLPLILCSHDENFAWLNRKDDGRTVIKLANPKTLEYQVVRTTLLPGLLKTLRENKGVALPLRLIEVSDVAFKDDSSERKTRNERHFAAAYCGKSASFEVVHGLLDRILSMLRTAFVTHEPAPAGQTAGPEARRNASEPDGYFIEEISEPTFFAGRAAAICLRVAGETRRIGELGVLHPTVLEKFGLKYPVSTLELNLEVFL